MVRVAARVRMGNGTVDVTDERRERFALAPTVLSPIVFVPELPEATVTALEIVRPSLAKTVALAPELLPIVMTLVPAPALLPKSSSDPCWTVTPPSKVLPLARRTVPVPALLIVRPNV